MIAAESARERLLSKGVDVGQRESGQFRMRCPKCSEKRKKRDDLCLSVNIDREAFYCFNCSFKGRTKEGLEAEGKEAFEFTRTYKLPEYDTDSWGLDDEARAYWNDRGISDATLMRYGVGCGMHFMSSTGKEEYVTSMPNFKGGLIVNVQYRGLDEKCFQQEKDCERTFYGMDDLFDDGGRVRYDTLFIVEGYQDKWSLAEAGYFNAVSVPDGAPAVGARASDQKFEYLQSPDVVALLGHVKTVVIAVDNDAAGKQLEEELTRRIGIERCMFVVWPIGSKDANDVLVSRGASDLVRSLEARKPYPVEGVITVTDLRRDVDRYYELGVQKGRSTGWSGFDRICTLEGGQLWTVTGAPNSGKSEWLVSLVDGILRENAKEEMTVGWYTPESYPLHKHVRKLAQVLKGKPFGREGDSDRMSKAELEAALRYIERRHTYILPEDTTIEGVLQRARSLVLSKGIKVLILDPYNRFYHDFGRLSETNYISQKLDRIQDFARRNGCDVFLVAHPRKLEKREDGEWRVASAYDIAGCYSDDTEILTKSGWKLHQDWEEDEEIACFDLKTSSVEFAAPTKQHIFSHKGKMHQYKAKGMDMLVTPNHRMVLSLANKKYKGNWKFVESQNISLSPLLMPVVSSFAEYGSERDTQTINGRAYEMDDFLRLLGWWISEGCVLPTGLEVCQAEGVLAQRMRECVCRLGLVHSATTRQPSRQNEKPMCKIYIGNRGNPSLRDWFEHHGGKQSHNKRIPDFVWLLSKRQKRILYEALVDGDGSRYANGRARYYTSSPQLADEFHRLAVEIGFHASRYLYPPKELKWKDKWVIEIANPSKKSISLNRERCRSDVEYDGLVYCFTVPTGAYLTRRNGKIALQGNSANFFNKSDNVLSIWRSILSRDMPVEAHIQKGKDNELVHAGSTGYFSFDRRTGRYAHLSNSTDEELIQL